jgi:hypothetical protein
MSSSKSEQWKKYLQEWRDSGLSAREFCARQGIQPNQLAYWKKRISNEAIPVNNFAEVVVTEANAGAAMMLVITTRFGCRVEVPI